MEEFAIIRRAGTCDCAAGLLQDSGRHTRRKPHGQEKATRHQRRSAYLLSGSKDRPVVNYLFSGI
jgi:hypothetical protein